MIFNVLKVTVDVKTKFGERVILDVVDADGNTSKLWLNQEQYDSIKSELNLDKNATYKVGLVSVEYNSRGYIQDISVA